MAQSFDSATLAALVGKVLRIYKGGPESRVGKLIGVKTDYLLVDTEEDGLIYYTIDHIKSLVEDLNGAAKIPDKPADFYARFLAPLNLNEVLTGQKYELIRVDRGGPESRVGRLVAIGTDFFAILTKEDGLVYYQLSHVKSISEETNNNDNSITEIPALANVLTLADAFGNLHNFWIKINRDGPESVEGVLSDNTTDHIVLVKNKEIFRISTFHIRNFSYQDPSLAGPGSNGDDKQAGENGKKNDNKKKR
jgi:spore coat protein B